ncbi:hypothetical protein D1B33_02955 [Lysinibacillus yapensis]|uniref:DUF4367 domain-containing protein n=1 Tax=Ureibacillus yapensis TaxID=2304605 RepID=A0A396SLD1_9BACL|nr:hypothetical protein [Lysinibacillus yapensis]RHW39827.1 hypothetical protein D1B33_02955 [Lysinibacillus yapensis]
MTKKFRLLSLTLLLSIGVLAACNTAEEEPANETATDETETQEPVNSEKPVETAEPNNGSANEEDENGEAEQPAQEEPNAEEEPKAEDTQSITYTSNGETKTAEVTPVSGEQYSMNIMDGFTFTQEEPGKDVVYYDENDSVFMRVEVSSVNDAAFDDVVANTEEMMAAISDNVEQYDVAPLVEGQDISNQAAYIADLESEEVIAFVFERGDKVVRLSVYDNAEADLSEAMIKMGLTIK